MYMTSWRVPDRQVKALGNYVSNLAHTSSFIIFAKIVHLWMIVMSPKNGAYFRVPSYIGFPPVALQVPGNLKSLKHDVILILAVLRGSE